MAKGDTENVFAGANMRRRHILNASRSATTTRRQSDGVYKYI